MAKPAPQKSRKAPPSKPAKRGVSAGAAGAFIVVTLGIAYVALMKWVLDSGTPVAATVSRPAIELIELAPPSATLKLAEQIAQLAKEKAHLVRPAKATKAGKGAPVVTTAPADDDDDATISILWPIRSTRLSSGFGYRINPITHDEQHHRGVDVPAPCGSHVLAIEDGEVIFAEYTATAGNMVKIAHDGGWTTVYMHLARPAVKVGARVSAGELIGFSGDTGIYTTGPHLHFELWKGNHAINPTHFRYHMPAGPSFDPSPTASCGPHVELAAR